MNDKVNSPFTPGNPVPVELFVGRHDKIKEIIRYIKQTSSGKQENVFLVGDRGIGKRKRCLPICKCNISNIYTDGIQNIQEKMTLIKLYLSK